MVGCMDECNMIAVIQTDLLGALSPGSVTCIPSMTQIVFANLDSNLDCALLLIGRKVEDIMLINCQSPGVESWTFIWLG